MIQVNSSGREGKTSQTELTKILKLSQLVVRQAVHRGCEIGQNEMYLPY